MKGNLSLKLSFFIFFLYILPFSQEIVQVKKIDDDLIMDQFESRDANFGGVISVGGMSGYFNITDPLDACKPVQPITLFLAQKTSSNNNLFPGISYKPYLPFFALVRRGGCSYVTKVRNCQNANYSAVIVYQNISSSELIIMDAAPDDKTEDIFIPAAFVSFSTGMELIKYSFSQNFYVQLWRDDLFPWAIYIWPMVFVLVVTLVAMGIGFILKTVLDYIRERRNRLSKKHLRQLTEKRFNKQQDSYETCVICLEDYVDGEKIRILPCGHAFHSTKCIDPWLLKNKRNCPICKRRIVFTNLPPHLREEEDNIAEQGMNESQPLLSVGQASAYGSNPSVNTFHTQNNNSSSMANLLSRQWTQIRQHLLFFTTTTTQGENNNQFVVNSQETSVQHQHDTQTLLSNQSVLVANGTSSSEVNNQTQVPQSTVQIVV